MKISGFTIVKNGVILDYPFLESIKSILPICDEFIVAVGKGDDNTKELIASLNEEKIKLIDTEWNPQSRTGGFVLSEQTNIAKSYISGDWGFFIQADEVIHEKYLEVIKSAAQQYLNDPKVDGLLFSFKHFYGSYDYFGLNRDWYRNEIRMIKNLPHIKSYKDAQGFRNEDNTKLRVKPIPAQVYHYGWVRSPFKQEIKKKHLTPLWKDDDFLSTDKKYNSVFRYNRRERLQLFKEEHPKVMKERIERMNWKFPYNPEKIKVSLKEDISLWIEKIIGIRIGEYKNYKIV